MHKKLIKAWGFLILWSLSGAQAATNMTLTQGESYWTKARIKAEGSWEGIKAVAVIVPGGKTGGKLEVWGKKDEGYTLLATAPNAGCLDCSGPSHKPNPTKVWFSDGSLNVEYQGGGSGAGFWAWRSTWGTDPAFGGARAIATQRIGADAQSDTRHVMVNFIEGSRNERTLQDGNLRVKSCRASMTKLPTFEELSLSSLFDGTLEPECLSGTEKGDALAGAPSLGSGQLDLMRKSPTKVSNQVEKK